MSHFIYNEQCPKCARLGNDMSKDNLAVYSDEHKYCFRCGYYVPANKINIIKNYKQEKPNEFGLTFPEKCDLSIETLGYLKRFGLTDKEIETHLYGHQDGYMFKDSKFFFIRRLHKLPKVITHGQVVGNEPIFGSETYGDTIVLCEDIISGIKISRIIDACALLKTNISDILLLRLSKRYKNCILWLDPDMHRHMAEKLLPQVAPYFNIVRIIMKDKDPKYYSTEEIKEILS